jgi:hypothetical protein
MRESPKILSPQPSGILRLTSQRTTNAHLIREQVITEFHMSTPDRSFEFQEIPSYLALYNLSLPDYTSESDSDPNSQSSLTSTSTQHQSPVLPIVMAAPSTMLPRGHSSTPEFTPDIPRELQCHPKELEPLPRPAQAADDMEKKKHICQYVDINMADLWEAIPEFDEFKSAIFKLYHGSKFKHKWTIADMDKVVGEQLWMGILDIFDLGNYF